MTDAPPSSILSFALVAMTPMTLIEQREGPKTLDCKILTLDLGQVLPLHISLHRRHHILEGHTVLHPHLLDRRQLVHAHRLLLVLELDLCRLIAVHLSLIDLVGVRCVILATAPISAASFHPGPTKHTSPSMLPQPAS